MVNESAMLLYWAEAKKQQKLLDIKYHGGILLGGCVVLTDITVGHLHNKEVQCKSNDRHQYQ